MSHLQEQVEHTILRPHSSEITISINKSLIIRLPVLIHAEDTTCMDEIISSWIG